MFEKEPTAINGEEPRQQTVSYTRRQRNVALGTLGLTTGFSVLSMFNPGAAAAINQVLQAFFMATGNPPA